MQAWQVISSAAAEPAAIRRAAMALTRSTFSTSPRARSQMARARANSRSASSSSRRASSITRSAYARSADAIRACSAVCRFSACTSAAAFLLWSAEAAGGGAGGGDGCGAGGGGPMLMDRLRSSCGWSEVVAGGRGAWKAASRGVVVGRRRSWSSLSPRWGSMAAEKSGVSMAGGVVWPYCPGLVLGDAGAVVV
ncbi:uncharacterized protein LOC105914502 [Setaria italica]|uniref:uncharacterized protein LOC105914502 n=1 Tax=Setaria italica TaxID=4555 RepID=UPI000647EBEC|nr:uncharacterized protein LOC105914502 [Setaria italica]